MNFLLDTHYILWAIADSGKISKKVKNIITQPANTIFVSAISFWEVSLKSGLGKLQITGLSPEELPEYCLRLGFNIIPVSGEDCSTYHQLKASYHKDPFDRMLIWQAIRLNYTLVSADERVAKYHTEGLKILMK